MRFALGDKPKEKAVLPKSEKGGTRMHPVVDVKNAIVPIESDSNNSRVLAFEAPNPQSFASSKNDETKSRRKTTTSAFFSAPSLKSTQHNSSPNISLEKELEYNISSPSDITKTASIGKGAYGEVYECTLNGLGDRKFAVKIQPGHEKDLLEADILKKYRHANIINIIAYFKVKTEKYFVHYLVMEKFTTSLGKEISIRAKEKKIFKRKEVHFILESILKGISFLHNHKKPIMHRDIKSDNILLMKDESSNITKVCLTDFGVSRETERGRLYETIAGSPAYWAPEMFQHQYANPCDIWAFGVVAYELIFKEIEELSLDMMVAFKGKINSKPSNRKLRIYVPIIEASLQIEPKRRPTSDKFLEYLGKIPENSSSSSEEDEPDDGKDSPELETFDNYSLFTNDALKQLCDRKPNLKTLNIMKQDIPKLELSEQKIGVSKSCLSRLEKLQIRKCKQISEITLVLPNLKILVIENCPHLKKLEISAPILQTIQFSGCSELNDTSLLKGLKKCLKIKNLKISECPKIYQSDLIQIVPTIAINPEFSPEFLQLIYDLLHNEEIKAITEALAHSKSVKRIILNFNFDLTGNALKQILEENSSIENITFVRFDISSDMVQVVSSYLTSLKSLTIEKSSISENGIVLLANAVKSASSLRTLIFRNIKITIKSVEYLADAVSKSSISSFYLQSIDVADLAAIFFLLKKSNLEKFDCSGNPLNEESMKALSSLISSNEHIESLYLNRCSITDALLEKLFAFKDPVRLQNLYLEENSITNEGMHFLGEKMEDMNLKNISLRRNQIETNGLDVLCKVFKLNNAIELIDLRDNKIESLSPIIQIFQSCQLPTTIQMKGNNISNTEKAALIGKGIEANIKL